MISCSGEFSNLGCAGGLVNNLFDYAMENPILTSADYPYDATDSCLNLENENNYTLTNYTMIQSGSASELKAAVALSPVVVSLRAGNSIFRHY